MEAKAIELFKRFSQVTVLYRTDDGEYFIELDDCQAYLTIRGSGSYSTVERTTPLPTLPTPWVEPPVIWGVVNNPLAYNATPATNPALYPQILIYNVSTVGTYTNFRDSSNASLVINSSDLAGGLVQFRWEAGSWKKTVVPVATNGEVADGDIRAVSGDKVAKGILASQRKFIITDLSSSEIGILNALDYIRIYGLPKSLDLRVRVFGKYSSFPRRVILSSSTNDSYATFDFPEGVREMTVVRDTGSIEVSVDWDKVPAFTSYINTATHNNSRLIVAKECYEGKVDTLRLADTLNQSILRASVDTVGKLIRLSDFSSSEIGILNALDYIRIYGLPKSLDLRVRVFGKYSSFPRRVILSSSTNDSYATFDFPEGVREMTVVRDTGSIEVSVDWDKVPALTSYINTATHNNSRLIVAKECYGEKAVDINEFNKKIDSLYIPQEGLEWSLKYWNSSGALQSFENYCHSNFFKVLPYATVFISGQSGVGGGAAARRGYFFDENFNPVAELVNLTTVVDSNLTVNFENIRYVSICHNNIENVSGVSIIVQNPTVIQELQNSISLLGDSPNLKAKKLCVLGDSIMMLMRTGWTGTNTVTYRGSDGNLYNQADLTIVIGRYYVTSSLGPGSVIEENSIEVEIENSKQVDLDKQNWDRLKNSLGLDSLINLGLGGARVAERDIVTAYPYPDGDGRTTSLPNQVRALKRLVDDGLSAPSAILIAIGTNGAGEPTIDNYDDIMNLSWEVLSGDSVEGLSNRKTFYGGLRFSIEFLYRNFKNTTIIFSSPIQTNPENYRTYEALSHTRDALRKMANRYACAFIDSLTESGIVDYYESADGSGYFLSDGLHLKTEGKILYTNFLASRLSKLFYSKS